MQNPNVIKPETIHTPYDSSLFRKKIATLWVIELYK